MQSWQGFVAWAEAFGITTMQQVKAGPERIQATAKFPMYKKYVEQFLAKRKARYPLMNQVKVQKYADTKEQKAMLDCHEGSYQILGQFMDELQQLDKGRALEVAAGDGRTTKDLLRHRFEKVDCFD